MNRCIREAVEDIAGLPSMNGCLETFLNPEYDRAGDDPATPGS